MNTNRPSASIIAFAPEMAKFTSEKAFVCTLAPLVVDRVCDLTLLLIIDTSIFRKRERERKMGVSHTRARGKRTRGLYPFARSSIGAFFFFQFFFPESVSPGKTHFCGVILLSSILSLLLRARANVYGLILKENAAKETNLEKVAVVRIGKAVCKANDMVVLFCLVCVDMRRIPHAREKGKEREKE
jgi:hypothetical protein